MSGHRILGSDLRGLSRCSSLVVIVILSISSIGLTLPFIAENAEAATAIVVPEPYIFVPDGGGAKLLLDRDDNLYWVHTIGQDVYFRKYDYNHVMRIPDTLLYDSGANDNVDAAMDTLGYIHLTWTTNLGDKSVMYAKIDKNGTIVVPPLRLSGDNMVPDFSPAIAVNSIGQAYVAWDYWFDYPNYLGEDVLYAKIDSDGSIMFTQQYVAPEVWDTDFHGKKDLVVDRDDNLHIMFDRVIGGFNIELYYKKYASDGVTVLVGEKSMVSASYQQYSSTMEAEIDSQDRINIAYSLGVAGGFIEVFYVRSDLQGNLDAGPILLSSQDNIHSHQAYLALDKYDNSYVFWRELKHGNAEIYYSVLSANATVIVPQTRLTDTLDDEQSYYMAAVFDSYDFCIWSRFNSTGTYVVYHQAPLPPALTTHVLNDVDVLLDWTPYVPLFTDHYLIYRSPDQREFDFTSPLHSTENDPDPLRTDWVDYDAAGPGAPREYYYIVRAVSALGMKSNTSNTAGKWTRDFSAGLNTFALPLKPFEDHEVSWYAEQIPNIEFIRWMNSTGHWVTHHKGLGVGVKDSPVEMGRGYEISLAAETRFSFCGYPASMIRFHEGLGDSMLFRNGLSAQKSGLNVALDWSFAAGSNGYAVLRSTVRNGVHTLSAELMITLPPTANTWTDYDVLSSEGEYYYIVIPLDADGFWGSSTYSVGVVTMEYQKGSDTFALPLKVIEAHTLDWYCDEIPNVVGMAYVVQEVWKFHASEMASGVYNVEASYGDGYQISSDVLKSRFSFFGY